MLDISRMRVSSECHPFQPVTSFASPHTQRGARRQALYSPALPQALGVRWGTERASSVAVHVSTEVNMGLVRYFNHPPCLCLTARDQLPKNISWLYGTCSMPVQMSSEEEFNEAVGQSKSMPLAPAPWLPSPDSCKQLARTKACHVSVGLLGMTEGGKHTLLENSTYALFLVQLLWWTGWQSGVESAST